MQKEILKILKQRLPAANCPTCLSGPLIYGPPEGSQRSPGGVLPPCSRFWVALEPHTHPKTSPEPLKMAVPSHLEISGRCWLSQGGPFCQCSILMADTTILDPSGVVLSILRPPPMVPQVGHYLFFPGKILSVCPILGPAKHVNYTSMFMTDTTVHDHCGPSLNILKAPSCTTSPSQQTKSTS